MDKYQLFDLIGRADDAYITETPVGKNTKTSLGRKKLIAVLAAAALLITLGVSAGAAYYFSMPKDLETNLHVENVDITSFDNDGFILQNNVVSTCAMICSAKYSEGENIEYNIRMSKFFSFPSNSLLRTSIIFFLYFL